MNHWQEDSTVMSQTCAFMIEGQHDKIGTFILVYVYVFVRMCRPVRNAPLRNFIPTSFQCNAQSWPTVHIYYPILDQTNNRNNEEFLNLKDIFNILLIFKAYFFLPKGALFSLFPCRPGLASHFSSSTFCLFRFFLPLVFSHSFANGVS